MAKVVYETPALQFEVQRWDQDESYSPAIYEAISGRWTAVYRSSGEVKAVQIAQEFQWANPLEKYRVVDTFAASEDDNG